MTHEQFQQRFQYNPATDKLGEGGFGKVFKAYDTHRDRWVAIKIAEVKVGLEQARLKKEVELVNKLPSHPNIAYYEECYTFSSFAGEYDFGILQFYQAGNLQQLADKTQLSLTQKEVILTQLLEGIGFLHSHGIIHRDLKPQNILIVNRNGEYIPKITDFGISKQLDINKSSVFNNSLAGAGTLSFASPEQLGDRTIRKNTDLWSFGVIAFWMLTGKLPFNTGSHASTSETGRAELLRQITSGVLPSSLASLEPRWQNLIKSCLIVHTETRIHKADDCLALLSGKTPPPPPPPKPQPETEIKNPPKPTPTPTPLPAPVATKNYTPYWLLAAAAVIIIVLLVMNSNNNSENDRAVTQPLQGKPAIEWVDIPAGTFTMGSPVSETSRHSDETQHQVTLSAFRMSKYEVTFEQYDAFCVATGRSKPEDEGWGRGRRPVINVSWDDAKAFADWMGCRLPTEAEWEYAARAGTTTPFNTGNCLSTAQANYKGNYPYSGCSKGEYREKTMPVGSFPANAWGLHDMHGNVWEWCSDWKGDYPSAAQTNPKGPASGSHRLIRGGGWSFMAIYCRSADRFSFSPGNRFNFIGFRLVSPK